jgi:hypothetical protein
MAWDVGRVASFINGLVELTFFLLDPAIKAQTGFLAASRPASGESLGFSCHTESHQQYPIWLL